MAMTKLDPPLFLRPANKGDDAAIKALIYRILREYGLEPDPEGTDQGLENRAEFFTLFDVVEDRDRDGAIIATVGLVRKSQKVCELVKMFADRSYRGRGLGRFLLDHAMDRARALGFSRMELETASQLVEAIGLYRQAGFEELPARPEAARCDKVMAKTL